MPGDRDGDAPAEPDDSGWDQAEFWERHAGTSRPEPPDTAPRNAIWDEVADEQDGGTTSRPDRRVPDFGAPAHPLITLRAAKGIAVAILLVLVASVAWVSFSRLSEPAIDSAPGPAVEPSQGESLVAPDPPSASPTEATPTPSESSPQPTPSPSPMTHSPKPTRKVPTTHASAPTPSKTPPTATASTLQIQFSSRVSGKSFGVWQSSTGDGARIVAIGAGGPLVRWRLVGVGSGFFNIINVGTGKALDNPDGSDDQGAPMQQYTIIEQGNANQQWQFVDVGAGYALIVNRASGMALDLRQGVTADGTVIQQWTPWRENPNQQWRLVAVG